MDRCSTWVRVYRGSLIKLGLEPRCHAVVRRFVRARTACWRHTAGAQLPDDLFPCLWFITYSRDIHPVKHESCRLQFVVVARHTISVEIRLVVGGSCFGNCFEGSL